MRVLALTALLTVTLILALQLAHFRKYQEVIRLVLSTTELRSIRMRPSEAVYHITVHRSTNELIVATFTILSGSPIQCDVTNGDEITEIVAKWDGQQQGYYIEGTIMLSKASESSFRLCSDFVTRDSNSINRFKMDNSLSLRSFERNLASLGFVAGHVPANLVLS